MNTSQHVGGSIGTALLNALAVTAAANYLTDHAPVRATIGVHATVNGYSTAYWWGAGLRAVGALISALLFRRRG